MHSAHGQINDFLGSNIDHMTINDESAETNEVMLNSQAYENPYPSSTTHQHRFFEEAILAYQQMLRFGT